MELLRKVTKHLYTPITLVLGRICAGKSSYCRQFPDKKHIAVSNIVRKLSGVHSRKALQDTGSLARLISDEIIREIHAYDGDVLVDGIRQYSIIRRIVKEFGRGEVGILWLEVPERERRKRFESRERPNELPFRQADLRDDDMGLSTIEDWAKQYGRVIHNY